MLPVPPHLETQFEDRLRRSAVPKMAHGSNKNWLRYYLDFCERYRFPAQHRESLFEFLRKLEEKRQSKAQQEQAASTIGFLYEIYEEKPPSQKPRMAVDLGGATARKSFSEDLTRSHVGEISSKLWGDRNATDQRSAWPERTFGAEVRHVIECSIRMVQFRHKCQRRCLGSRLAPVIRGSGWNRRQSPRIIATGTSGSAHSGKLQAHRLVSEEELSHDCRFEVIRVIRVNPCLLPWNLRKSLQR
jgi:hypothetical protein